MNPDELRKVLVALTQSDHKYKGVRPADATPANAPCVILPGDTAAAFSYAANEAGGFWPECSTWSLIGGDEQLLDIDPRWSPNMRMLREPDELTGFLS